MNTQSTPTPSGQHDPFKRNLGLIAACTGLALAVAAAIAVPVAISSSHTSAKPSLPRPEPSAVKLPSSLELPDGAFQVEITTPAKTSRTKKARITCTMPKGDAPVSLSSYLKGLDQALNEASRLGIATNNIESLDHLDLGRIDTIAAGIRSAGFPTHQDNAALTLKQLLKSKPALLAPILRLLHQHQLGIKGWEDEEASFKNVDDTTKKTCQILEQARLSNIHLRPYGLLRPDLVQYAPRGEITSSDGSLLASNLPGSNLVIDTHKLLDLGNCIRVEAQSQTNRKQSYSFKSQEDIQAKYEETHQELMQQVLEEPNSSLFRRFFDKCALKFSLANKDVADNSSDPVQSLRLDQAIQDDYRKNTVETLMMELRTSPLAEQAENIINDFDSIEQKLSTSARIVISTTLDSQDPRMQRTLQDLAKCRIDNCLTVQDKPRRHYPHGSMLAHTLGYVSFDQQGKTGIEENFNSELAGRNGNPDLQTQPGDNLTLSIDLKLQQILEDNLLKAIYLNNIKRGAGIVIDGTSGEILAITSLPAFDLNTKEGITNHSLDYASRGLTEFGGLSRLFAAAVAWDSGVATPDTAIDCSPLNQDALPQGKENVDAPDANTTLPARECLTRMSLPGIARLGMASGWERYRDTLERFQMTKPWKTDFSRGTTPTLHDGKQPAWFSDMSNGFGLAATPLHLAAAYAAVGNDGKLMKPHVVRMVVPANSGEKKEIPHELVSQAVSPTTAQAIREAMEANVRMGSDKAMQIPGLRTGGFSGTIPVPLPGGHQSATRYSSACAGMFSMDRPGLVCIIMLYDMPKDIAFNNPAQSLFRIIGQQIREDTSLLPKAPQTEEELGNQGELPPSIAKLAAPFEKHMEHGQIQLNEGQYKEALSAFEHAYQLCTQLLQLNPEQIALQRMQSRALIGMGDVCLVRENHTKALISFEHARTIQEKLVATNPSDKESFLILSRTLDRIGKTYSALGKHDKSLNSFLKDLDISQRLVANEPNDVELQINLSISYNNIGDENQNLGKLEDALKAYHQALNIREELNQCYPEDSTLLPDLSSSYWRIGNIHYGRNKYFEALEYAEKALNALESRTAAEPDDLETRFKAIYLQQQMVDIYNASNQGYNAVLTNHKILAASQELVEQNPDNPRCLDFLAITYCNLAPHISDESTARSYWQQAEEIMKSLSTRDPDNNRYKAILKKLLEDRELWEKRMTQIGSL